MLRSFAGDVAGRSGHVAKRSRSRRDLHVFEIARLVVDADLRWRDPARELPGLDHGVHEALDEVAVLPRRQPGVLLFLPSRLPDRLPFRRDLHVLELADLAVEGDVR